MFHLKTSMIVATLLSTVIGSAALAQTPPRPAFDRSAEFSRVELVPGLFGTPEQLATLKERECVIGPTYLVAPIIEKMGNSCDTRMFKKLSAVHKSGSLLWMLTLTPAGIHLSLSDKVVNLGNNLQDGMVFPYVGYADPRMGIPLIHQQASTAGGATVKAQIVGGVLASVLNGVGASAIAAATNPCNGGNCGGTYNIQGGYSVANAGAEAGAVAQSPVQVTAGATINGANGGCPTGNCKQ